MCMSLAGLLFGWITFIHVLHSITQTKYIKQCCNQSHHTNAQIWLHTKKIKKINCTDWWIRFENEKTVTRNIIGKYCMIFNKFSNFFLYRFLSCFHKQVFKIIFYLFCLLILYFVKHPNDSTISIVTNQQITNISLFISFFTSYIIYIVLQFFFL